MSGFKLHCISSDIRGYFAYESFVPPPPIEQNYLWTAEQPPLEMFQMLGEVQNTSFSLLEAKSMLERRSKQPRPPNQDTACFIFTHDDVLPNYTRLDTFLKNPTQNAIATPNPWPNDLWVWTNTRSSRLAYKLHEIQYLTLKPEDLRWGQSYFFFVHLQDAKRVALVGRQLLQNGLFLEIAVPSLIQVMPSTPRFLNLYTLWDKNRSNPDIMLQQACQGAFDIVHPIEISTHRGLSAHLLTLGDQTGFQ